MASMQKLRKTVFPKRAALSDRRRGIRHSESGVTLIEMMVVLVIIGIVASLVVPQVMGRPDQARVAAELYLSEATVKTYVSRLLTKLDRRDRVQLAVLAYETGLVRAGEATAER